MQKNVGSPNSFVKEIGLNINFRSFGNVTVVIATYETLSPLTLFNAKEVILCIELISVSERVFIVRRAEFWETYYTCKGCK